MPAVARVQASSTSILSGAGALVDDSSSPSQDFMQVLDRAAGSAAQKSAPAAKADAPPSAVSARSGKSGKKDKPSKVGKNDAPVEQIETNPSAKSDDAPAPTQVDDTAVQDTEPEADQSDPVTATAIQEQTQNDAEAQLAAYVTTAQSSTQVAPANPTRLTATAAKTLPKVQQALAPKIAAKVQPIGKDTIIEDTSETEKQTPAPTQTADDQLQAKPAPNLPKNTSDTKPDAPTDSLEHLAEQLRPLPERAQAPANPIKSQVAPKVPGRQSPAFGQSILRDARVDVSVDAATGNDGQAKAAAAPTVQALQPIDADTLISVVEDKGRAKSDGDDANDGRDAAVNAVPAAPLKVAHPPASPIDKAPDTRFAEVNHPEIVNNIRGQLLPNGGNMQLRLDPPDLGRLDVTVTVRDGVISAAFATANDQATRLLSHSLGQLKSALESAGVTVEKLQVQQSPKSQGGDPSDPQQQARDQQDPSARQEQQRKEILQRMWERISMGPDDVDVMG